MVKMEFEEKAYVKPESTILEVKTENLLLTQSTLDIPEDEDGD